jgi:hypothetical protein
LSGCSVVGLGGLAGWSVAWLGGLAGCPIGWPVLALVINHLVTNPTPKPMHSPKTSLEANRIHQTAVANTSARHADGFCHGLEAQ